jgi:hypothetical protein
MKKIIIVLLFLLSCICFAQKDCEYSTNVTDSIGTYKSTNDYIIHERKFGNSNSTLFFSLINAEGLPSLKIQLIQKDTDFIPAKCFDKNSKIITLLGIDYESCGESIRNENGNSRILTGYFLFMKDTFDALQNSPITFMRIKYSTETNDYILKNELISELDKKTYNPDQYFINYLKCIIN